MFVLGPSTVSDNCEFGQDEIMDEILNSVENPVGPEKGRFLL